MRRSLTFALAAGIAGLIIGRALPQDTPRRTPAAASAAPTGAPLDCNTERTQLASVRAQLGICLAFQARSLEPEPAPPVTSAPEAPSVEPPPTATIHSEEARIRAEQAKIQEMLASVSPKHVPQVIVRHADGTLESYPAEDWPPDRNDEQVIARESAEHPAYYETDAGLMRLSDLVGADGIIKRGGMRFRWLKPDAAAP